MRTHINADEYIHVIDIHECFMAFEEDFEDIRNALIINMNAQIQSLPAISEVTETSTDDEKILYWVRSQIRKHQIERIMKAPLASFAKIEAHLRVQNMSLTERAQYEVSQITEEEKIRAKEFPIITIYERLTNNTVRNKLAKCPFHNDGTASLSLGKYNRFNCFGCGEKGDAIELYKRLAGVSFKDAVREINKMCI